MRRSTKSFQENDSGICAVAPSAPLISYRFRLPFLWCVLSSSVGSVVIDSSGTTRALDRVWNIRLHIAGSGVSRCRFVREHRDFDRWQYSSEYNPDSKLPLAAHSPHPRSQGSKFPDRDIFALSRTANCVSGTDCFAALSTQSVRTKIPRRAFVTKEDSWPTLSRA